LAGDRICLIHDAVNVPHRSTLKVHALKASNSFDSVHIFLFLGIANPRNGEMEWKQQSEKGQSGKRHTKAQYGGAKGRWNTWGQSGDEYLSQGSLTGSYLLGLISLGLTLAMDSTAPLIYINSEVPEKQ
jgi:hypothetical protein